MATTIRAASGVFEACWYNAVTLALSSDGGQSFRHARPPPGNLVAALPYRYKDGAGPFGVFQPSNIVYKDGYYYSLVYTQRYRAQENGTCVMRTKSLADPTSWRAWNGDKFDVTFVNPYRAEVAAGDRDPVYYPSVLDPTSKSRNFETTGRRPYLYFTRFHYRSCNQTLDRDLVRLPIKFSK
jgi:hypothetical protein